MRQLLTDAWTLAWKEITQLRRDPAALALTFIVPLLMVGSLGFALIGVYGGRNGDVSISVVVVDEDQTSLSIGLRDSVALVSGLKATETATTRDQAELLVQSGQFPGALIIPQGFEHHLLTRENAFVIVFTDNSKHSAPGVVRTSISKAIEQFASRLKGPQIGNFQISVETRTLTGREPGGWASMPGLLAIAVLLSSFDDVVIAITRERERGTLTRLGLTPINLISLYLGKTISTVLLTFARTTEMLLVFVLLLGIPMKGNVGLVYVVTVAIGICTLALGFALSTKLQGEATITIVEIITTLPLLFLTGIFLPTELMAEDGQRIAWLLPWTYGVDALRRVISLGQGLFEISTDLLMLSVATMAFMMMAVALFRRQI